MFQWRVRGSVGRMVGVLVVLLCVLIAPVAADRGRRALDFDGINDYVTLGNPSSLQLSGDMTVCAWVKPDEGTAGQYMGIAGKMNLAYDGFTLVRRDTNKISFFIGAPLDLYILTVPQLVMTSEWHHVAGVVDGGIAHIYLNGGLHARAPWTDLQLKDSRQEAYIGRQYSGLDGRYFEGLIDEVCFYDSGLSGSEIRTIMSDRPSTQNASLVGYWAMEGTGGQTVFDGSGHGNHGYLGVSSSGDFADPQRVLNGSDTPCQTQWVLTFNSVSEYTDFLTTNNDEHAYGGALPVARVVDQQLDRWGMLRLQNLRDQSVTSRPRNCVIPARATFTFPDTRCPNMWSASVYVAFDYLFRSPAGVLTVRLVNETGEGYAHTLTAPSSQSPGGRNSTVWGQYAGAATVPYEVSGDETLSVELELSGPVNTQVLINDLDVQIGQTSLGMTIKLESFADPNVRCTTSHCADIAGLHYGHIGPEDYHAAVYSCCATIGERAWCLDSEWTRDGAATVDDATYFAWIQAAPQICSCYGGALGAAAPASPAVAGRSYGGAFSLEAPLIVAGKAYQCDSDGNHHFLSDRLFGFDSGCRPVDEPCIGADDRLCTRLVRDDQGRLYQLHVTKGLVRLSDGQSVMPRRSFEVGGNYVDVGWDRDYGSPPIQDVTFDSAGDVYVVPVWVTPVNSQTSHRAAARIRLGATPGDYNIVRLYDSQNFRLFETGVHEIGVNRQGDVYVLDKRQWHNARILCYRGSGTELDVLPLTALPPARRVPMPTAFHVSPTDGRIYLADSYPFWDRSVVVLDGDLSAVLKKVVVRDIGYITDIAEEADTGALWLTGFAVGATMPAGDVRNGVTVGYKPRYKPFLARMERSTGGPVQAVCASEYEAGGQDHLSLPLSLVWVGDD